MANAAFLRKLQDGQGLISKAYDADDIEDGIVDENGTTSGPSESGCGPRPTCEFHSSLGGEDHRGFLAQRLLDEDPDEVIEQVGGETVPASADDLTCADPFEGKSVDDSEEIVASIPSPDEIPDAIPAPEEIFASIPSPDETVDTIFAPEEIVFSAPAGHEGAKSDIGLSNLYGADGGSHTQGPVAETRPATRRRPGPKPKNKPADESKPSLDMSDSRIVENFAGDEQRPFNNFANAPHEEPFKNNEFEKGSKDNGVAYFILDYVCKRTISGLLNTNESEIYTKAFASNLLNKYLSNSKTSSNPLFIELIRECIEKGVRDDYLGDNTEAILKYIIGE